MGWGERLQCGAASVLGAYPEDRGGELTDYQLYFIDRQDRIRRRLDLDCTDDDQAVRVVTEHADGSSMELWQGKRLVKRFARAPD